MTNFFSLNSKVVLIKEKTINASFDYKNKTCIYKNEACVYSLQQTERKFAKEGKKFIYK